MKIHAAAGSLATVWRTWATKSSSVRVGPNDAASLARGQAVLVRGRDAPVMAGAAWAHFKGRILALGELEKGAFRPTRVFNFG